MSKKISWLLLAGLVIIGSVVAVSCKKTVEAVVNNVDASNTAKAKSQSIDASFINGETDQTDNDVNNSASASAKMSGSGNNSTSNGVPDASIDSSSSLKTITINYNGTLPSGSCKKRTGSITVDLISGNRWIDVGAVIQYTFNNFKVFNVCTNKSVTINGTRTLTNVLGGNVYTLSLNRLPKLTHKVRANYNVTFVDSNGTTKTAQWNVARKTDIIYANSFFGFTSSGDTTISGLSSIESWGVTRDGFNYTTQFTTPIVSNTGCGLWKPTAGVVVHTVASFPFTVQYGLDASGNQVTSGCAAFYKVSWLTVAGVSVFAILPY